MFLSIPVLISFVLVQGIAAAIFLIFKHLTNPQLELFDFAAQLESNGSCVALATIASAAICVPVIFVLAMARNIWQIPQITIIAYFNLHRISLQTAIEWSVILICFAVGQDLVSLYTGHAIVPEFVRSIYDSASSKWLLWIALVLAAPLFEETFFRGFLFKGIQSSWLGTYGAVILTSLVWASIHLQYNFFYMGQIFAVGILLGIARHKTQSLYTPLMMHALMNGYAMGESYLHM